MKRLTLAPPGYFFHLNVKLGKTNFTLSMRMAKRASVTTIPATNWGWLREKTRDEMGATGNSAYYWKGRAALLKAHS